MMADSYQPKDPEAYARMIKFMSNANDAAELKGVVLLYLFDMSYPREDLLMAERETLKLKGWSRG